MSCSPSHNVFLCAVLFPCISANRPYILLWTRGGTSQRVQHFLDYFLERISRRGMVPPPPPAT
jgi:hypothetical protein